MSAAKAVRHPARGSRPQVLVLGGGFAGIGAAQKLRKHEVDVVIVDGHDYHTFQPLLYQVATDLLPPVTVGHPLRDLFDDQPNARVHTTEVTSVDLEKRRAEFAEMDPLNYDYLVLALGARVNFFGVKGASEHAFPLYTLADAVRLKEHILERWEAADKDPDLIGDGALNIVVVGGGPTGVESAGAIAELYRAIFVKDYPDIPQEKAQIVLVEAGPEIFTMFKTHLRKYAEKALSGRDVEVACGEVVESVTATRVTLKSGRVIPAHTLVWGAGLQANPIATSLGLKLEKGNRIPTQPDLSVAGHPEVFAAGDVAWITDTKTGEILPQLGSVALQSGHHAGQNIARRLDGSTTEPFKYFDKGTMATIGRGAAVMQGPHGRIRPRLGGRFRHPPRVAALRHRHRRMPPRVIDRHHPVPLVWVPERRVPALHVRSTRPVRQRLAEQQLVATRPPGRWRRNCGDRRRRDARMHATDSASGSALHSEHNRLPAADRGAPGRHAHPRQRRPNCRR